jgi:hypothetical protein
METWVSVRIAMHPAPLWKSASIVMALVGLITGMHKACPVLAKMRKKMTYAQNFLFNKPYKADQKSPLYFYF